MDLDALAIFVKVAELHSFTRAAEHLGMPKARVSSRVQALEAALGVRLFQRTTRTVRPTNDGEQLLPRAKQLVLEAEEVGTMFQGQRALKGLVRVDLPVNIARETVFPRLPELLAMYPQLELQISTTDRRVDVVKEGFDCVLSIGNLRSSGLTAQRIAMIETVNVASAGYVKKYGMPRTLEDLDRHLVVHYSLSFGTDSGAFEYKSGSKYVLRPMKSIITVNSADAYRAACVAGLGIIQAPNIGQTRLDLQAGAVVEVLPDYPAEPMPVSLVHPHGRSVPKRVRAVMSWLATVVTPRLS